MAVESLYYFDGKLIQPKNAAGISVVFNYDKDGDNFQQQISVGEIELVREDADLAMDWYKAGRIYEGAGFQKKIQKSGAPLMVFDGYVDFSDSPVLSDFKEGVTIKVKERQKIDWLNDRADSASFDYLASLGLITEENYIYMPYVISSIPNYAQALLSFVSVTVITIQIGEQIEQLAELFTGSANPFEWTTLLRVALRILYIITLIATLLALIKNISDLIIQEVKYHACMKVVDLFTIGAAYFGFTLSAEMLQTEPLNRMVIMPEKLSHATYNVSEGLFGLNLSLFGAISPGHIEQTGYPKNMTIGQFIRDLKSLFKAKIIINDNKELIFVREDKTIGTPQYQMPDLYQPKFTINAEDLKSNYVTQFQLDSSDKNTYQNYTGTIFQVITTQQGVIASDLDLLKGLETVSFPWARATMKTELTLPEEIVQAFLNAFSGLINALISIANVVIDIVNDVAEVIEDFDDALDVIGLGFGFDPPNISRINSVDSGDIIQNRLGMLLLENDFTSVAKLFLIDEGGDSKFNKISDDNDSIISAKYFTQNYHLPVISFLPSDERPNGNQYIIRDTQKIPFTIDDYDKVRINNDIYAANGDSAKIIQGEWNDFDETAQIKAKISYLYAPNLQESYIEPTGK